MSGDGGTEGINDALLSDIETCIDTIESDNMAAGTQLSANLDQILNQVIIIFTLSTFISSIMQSGFAVSYIIIFISLAVTFYSLELIFNKHIIPTIKKRNSAFADSNSAIFELFSKICHTIFFALAYLAILHLSKRIAFNLPSIVYEIRSLSSLVVFIIFYFTLRRKLIK